MPSAAKRPESLQGIRRSVDPGGVNRGPARPGPVAPATGRPELSGDDGSGPGAAPADGPGGLSPAFLAYVVGPIALVVLLVLRHFGLVATVPVWAYAGAIVAAQVSGQLVDRWHDAPPGSLRLHLRVAVHVPRSPSVIYMSGWGPALGMAFAFSALADLQQSGAAAWRSALGWSLVGCAVGSSARAPRLDAVLLERIAGADHRVPRRVRLRDRDSDGRSDRGAQGAGRDAARRTDDASGPGERRRAAQRGATPRRGRERGRRDPHHQSRRHDRLVQRGGRGDVRLDRQPRSWGNRSR